jgi:hypothetical protein
MSRRKTLKTLNSRGSRWCCSYIRRAERHILPILLLLLHSLPSRAPYSASMEPINHARVISLPGLFFRMSVTIALYSARKRNSCLWRSLISLPGKDFPRPGLLSKAGLSHSPMRISTHRWHWLTSARACLRAPMPHSAPPHCLDTAPEKGAGRSGLTPNKSWHCIQA